MLLEGSISAWLIPEDEWCIDYKEDESMLEVKKILQDEMDYSLCKLLLDYLHFKGMVDYLTVHNDGKVDLTFLDGNKTELKC